MPPPEARPVGRAALDLRRQGIVVLFGDALTREGDAVWMAGQVAEPGRWVSARLRLDALHDRYPSQRRAVQYQAALQALGEQVPLGNPPELTLLCRDKAACQRFLEQAGVPMPPLETEPGAFAAALAAWGGGPAFLKPRYGALGIGVRRVLPGAPLPAEVAGVIPGQPAPAILQRAVPPPVGWAGRSVRALCQRLPGGGWHLCPPVVRQSRADFVVNAARGAEVCPAEDALSPETRAALEQVCQATCAALAGGTAHGRWLVEVGLDLMIDDVGMPHLIEVNSRPRGRLEALAALDAARFGDLHVAACGRPLAYLASLS